MGKKIGFLSLVSSLVCLCGIMAVAFIIPFAAASADVWHTKGVLAFFVGLLVIAVFIVLAIFIAIGALGIFCVIWDIKAIRGNIKRTCLTVSNVLKLLVFCFIVRFCWDSQFWYILPVFLLLAASNVCVLVMLNKLPKQEG